MIFQKVTYYTNQLNELKDFYQDLLGFTVEVSDDRFSFKAGISTIEFVTSVDPHLYHYCFLIPCNKIQEATSYLSDRNLAFQLEDGSLNVLFETWNAESVYFEDPAGNIGEMIVRHDLDNPSEAPFTLDSIINLNEVGFPTTYIEESSEYLTSLLGTTFYKGNMTRFATHGDANANFLLPNYEVKDNWFPTGAKIECAPFQLEIIVDSKLTTLHFPVSEKKLNIQHTE